MKKQILIFLFILINACSSYSKRTEIEESAKINSFKKTGILFRIPANNTIQVKEYQKSLEFWLGSYKKINAVTVLKGVDKNINIVTTEFDRFYQVSSGNKFLKYKSTGIITIFLRNYGADLKDIMEKNGLDSLFILEASTIFSTEMQFCSYDSLLTGIDKNLKIVYMDHRKDSYDISELDTTRIKKDLLDKVLLQLLNQLEDFDYIEQ